MVEGITSYYSDLGPIHGVRIGMSVIFISTAITCLCLIKRQQKKTTTISALFLATISLIAASVLSSFWYLRADMRLLSTMGNPAYDKIKNRVLSHMTLNSDGLLLFPFRPWTPMMLLMNCFPMLNIIASIALIFITLNILFSFGFIEQDDSLIHRPPAKRHNVLFACIGTLFLGYGFVNNCIMILLPNVSYSKAYTVQHDLFIPMTMGSLALLLGGILTLAIAEHGGTAKKIGLLLLSIGTLRNKHLKITQPFYCSYRWNLR